MNKQKDKQKNPDLTERVMFNKMADLGEKVINAGSQVKTCFTGTSEELKEKVNKGFAAGVYLAESGIAGWCISECINGNYNPLLIPFAIDGLFRQADYLRKLINRYDFAQNSFELQGAVGTAKEFKVVDYVKKQIGKYRGK